jgi:hypothetical protein
MKRDTAREKGRARIRWMKLHGIWIAVVVSVAVVASGVCVRKCGGSPA